MKRFAAAGIGAGCVTALVAGWYLLSPFTAVAECRNAIVELNPERTSNCIDFPVLRENLKSDLPERLARQMRKDREFRDNPVGNFGMALLMPMVSAIVDAYVTPAGIRTAFGMAKSIQSSKKAGTENAGKAIVAKSSAELSKALKKGSLSYKGLDKFQVTGENNEGRKITLVFNRQGFADWKLSGIYF